MMSDSRSVLVVGNDTICGESIISILKRGDLLAVMAPDAHAAMEREVVLGQFAAVLYDADSSGAGLASLRKYAEAKGVPFLSLAVLEAKSQNDASSFLGLVQVALAQQGRPDRMALSKEGYCAVPIDDFILGRSLRYDLYIRIGESKYLKIAKLGDVLDQSRLIVYREHGAKYLYLANKDFAQYLGFGVMASAALAAKPSIPLERRAKLVAHAQEIVLGRLHSDRIAEEMLDDARSVAEASVAMLSSEEACLSILEMLRSHDDLLFSHSVGVDFYSVLIARQIGINDPDSLYKIATGALLHDVGKKELDRAILAKPSTERSPKEARLLESHPGRGMDILGPFTSLADEIVRIVIEHHENPLGVGYPNGMREKDIHPFSRIVATANEFCDLVLASSDGPGVDPAIALSLMWKTHRHYADRTCFVALLRAFRMSVDGKDGIVKPIGPA